MWKPRPSDIVWAKKAVSLLKEGGTWTIPRTGQRFQFFHIKKEIHFLGGGTAADRWLFERTVLCFSAIGYKMLESHPGGGRQEIKIERGKGKT